MITGDQLAIGKETGRRLGMGTNMYPSSTLLGQNKDSSVADLPVDELIEKADGFAGVFPGTWTKPQFKFQKIIAERIQHMLPFFSWSLTLVGEACRAQI